MLPPGVEVREVRPGDAADLAARMREQDVVEMHAFGCTDMLQVVEESLALSESSAAVTVHGELACILGLAKGGTHLTPYGVPWMLGTKTLERNSRSLLRVAPRYIASMLARYPELRNVVHVGNTMSLRWLKYLGFSFGKRYGDLIEFYKER